MVINQVGFADIRPPFNERNWLMTGNVKVEVVNDKLYSGIDKTHWIYPILKKNKQNTKTGFYMNSDRPHQLMRIVGKIPDLWVMSFRRKNAL